MKIRIIEKPRFTPFEIGEEYEVDETKSNNRYWFLIGTGYNVAKNFCEIITEDSTSKAQAITLHKITAYALEVSTDERTNEISGYYRKEVNAQLAAKGAGWYGSDGKVYHSDLWQDGLDNIYTLTPIGSLKEDEEPVEENLKAGILAKLSPEEIKFLGL